MNTKIILFTLILLNLQAVLAQNEKLNCNYFLSGTFYTCYLTIYNPNGFDGFTGVNGTHSGSYRDDDVKNITIYVSSSSVSTNIPSILCAKFKNLATISYNRIGIKRIGINSFKSCSKVQRINLENNEISEIHEQAFGENLELQFIEFSGNKITTLSENLLKNQTKLQSLDFCSNLITDLPENIFRNLQKLKSLSLCWNQISTLRFGWFKMLGNLETLNLGTNNISQLQQDIFKPLISTSNILLGNNKLRAIHCESFGVQPKLTTINLYGNDIFAFDEQFIDDTGLISIFMTDNVCISKNIYDSTQARESMRTDLKKCFENYQKLITRILKARVISLESHIELFNRKFEEVTNENQQFAINIQLLFDDNELLHSQIDRLNEENQELRDTNSKQNERISKLEEENLKHEDHLKDLESKIKFLTEQNKALNSTIANQNLLIDELIEEIQRLDSYLQSVSSKGDELQETIENFLEDRAAMDEKLQSIINIFKIISTEMECKNGIQ